MLRFPVRLRLSALCFGMLAISAFVASALAHEGHDHGLPSPPPAAAAPRADATSELFDLVLVADGPMLRLWIDRFADNAPVLGAQVEATLDGKSFHLVDAGDGVYVAPSPWGAASGSYALTLTVVSGADADLLPVTLVVPPPAEAAAPAGSALASMPWLWSAGGFLAGLLVMGVVGRARFSPAAATMLLALLIALPASANGPASPTSVPDSGPRRMPDGSLFVPKAAQRLLAVRTELVRATLTPRSHALIGTVVPDPNGVGRVQSFGGGRVETDGKALPIVGQRVERGQQLAAIAPAISAADRATVQQSTADVDAQIRIAERKLERLNAIPSAVTKREIEETGIELDGLRKQRAALGRPMAEREVLQAPVSGVVAQANVVAGQVVEPREVLFEIVDPARLWVEATAFDAAAAHSIESAVALADGGRSLPLALIGRGVALKQQALPLLFRIEGPAPELALGQPLQVLVRSRATVDGVVLPRTAVVRAPNGGWQVFDHRAAERFEAVPVRVESVDGSRVLVVAGLKPGVRVVVEGANLLAQVR